VLDEWHHEGKADGYQTDEQQASGLARWAASWEVRFSRRVADVFVDATARGLIKRLRTKLRGVRPIQFDVVASVKVMQQVFETFYAYIDPRCRWTLAELGNFVWDENSKNEDKLKDKQEDHHQDAKRYGVLGAMIRQSRHKQHRAMIAAATRIAP